MLKNLCALCVLLAAFGTLAAEEIKGKLAKIDAEKSTITLTVDGKEKVLNVDKEALVQSAPAGKGALSDVKEGLAGLKTGGDAEVTLAKKDGKEVVTRIIAIGGAAAKKKAK